MIRQPIVEAQVRPQLPPGRKRPRKEQSDDSAPGPRKLRRSHEACSRCRTKKIKCDSKHPRCSACDSAGSICRQEDRHRQRLTPRGYQEHIELVLRKCDALLKKKYNPNFSLDRLDEILAAESIHIDLVSPLVVGFPTLDNKPSGFQPTNVYPVHAPIYGPPPSFAHLPNGYPPPVIATAPVPGQDPQSLNVTNEATIARSFGFQLPSAILHAITASADSSSTATSPDKEDIGVGVGIGVGGDGRGIVPSPEPKHHDSKKWFPIVIRRGSHTFPSPSTSSAPHIDIHTAARLRELANENLTLWLPKDRQILAHIVDVYFSRLNIHRPVYTRNEFERELGKLYDESDQHTSHDPGFVCGLYLVLALGTLSELNRKLAAESEKNAAEAAAKGYPLPSNAPISTADLMPANWPEYTEFFHRALAIQPNLRITLSSLQALILLHWYLYTERQGRSLWRLVGSLVRMAVEMGLHHDPVPQTSEPDEDNPRIRHTFTNEMCRTRIRLWSIIILHDRGTSLLLGRPLGISPSDTNTPHPPMSSEEPFSEHFLLSHAIADLQADIVISLYQPGSNRNPQDIMSHARRIINTMVEFRSELPKVYACYFGGTDDWPVERRRKLLREITEDQGLTLLKLGIARILLLRAVISSPQVAHDQRLRALNDAIITSHNIIVVHHQLIRNPEIAFFTSPIPLHIAAMVILHGEMMQHMNPSPLSKQTATEDVWLALDMIPHWRWRWDRRDLGGEHPLIAHFANHILEVDLHQVRPSGDPYLLSEQEWTVEPLVKSQHSTPTLNSEGNVALPEVAPPIPEQVPNMNIINVAVQYMYPFYPEQVQAGPSNHYPPAPMQHTGSQQQYLGAQQLFDKDDMQTSYGCQPSESSYVDEVLDVGGGFPVQQQFETRVWQQNPHMVQSYPIYHHVQPVNLTPITMPM